MTDHKTGVDNDVGPQLRTPYSLYHFLRTCKSSDTNDDDGTLLMQTCEKANEFVLNILKVTTEQTTSRTTNAMQTYVTLKLSVQLANH